MPVEFDESAPLRRIPLTSGVVPPVSAINGFFEILIKCCHALSRADYLCGCVRKLRIVKDLAVGSSRIV